MSRKCLLLFVYVIFLVISSGESFAEGNKSTANQKSGNTSTSGNGDGDFSKESLFTGDVSFSVPVGSIGSMGVNLSYISNIHKLIHAGIKDAPTGWVGLGWSLNLGSIVADNNGTRDATDDHYFYISSSGTSELISIGASNDFRLKEYQYWKITRSLDSEGNIIGWTIVTDDGTTMRFGNYDKTGSGSFVFDTTLTKATRFLLGWGGVVCNPLNDLYYTGSFIAYQWDLSDIENITGHHTTITYQRIGECLTSNSVSTTLKYTQASYPYRITDRTGKYLEFVLGDLTTAEFITPPDKIIQRQYETKYLNKIVLHDQNDAILQQTILGYSILDIFNQSVSRRYLSSIITQDANGNPLPGTKFEYFSTPGNLGANPGALKAITYPTGSKVEYTYASQSLNRVTLDNYQEEGSYYSQSYDPPLFGSGSDFYAVKTHDGYIRVYRWGTTGWYQDNTFGLGGTALAFWVINDYIVLYSGGASLSIAKRLNDGWIYSSVTVDNSAFPGSMGIIAAGKDFFVLAHNLYLYNFDYQADRARRTENVSVVSFQDGTWQVDYIGSLCLGRRPIQENLHVKAVSGTDFFAVRYAYSVEDEDQGMCAVYVRNGSGWELKMNFEPNLFRTDLGFKLYAGPTYLITYGYHEYYTWNSEFIPKRVKIFSWPFSNFNNYKKVDINADEGIYSGTDYFVTKGTGGTPINICSFNGNSTTSAYDITNITSDLNGSNNISIATGNNYFVVGSVNINDSYKGSVYVWERSNNQSNSWNKIIVDEQEGHSSGSSVIAGNEFFTEWIDPIKYHKFKKYTKEFNTWTSSGSFDSLEIGYHWQTENEDHSITEGDVPGATSFQPGAGFLAEVIAPAYTTINSTHAFKKGTSSDGTSLYLGNPSDFPVATKTISDGMGHTYATTFTFENGVFDNDINYAKYNKITVTPSGNVGKTVTYFYNDLGPSQTEDFVDVANYKELDGLPYKVNVYSQNDLNNPMSITTNTWSVHTIDALNGIFHKRLLSATTTQEGITNTINYEYNSTNGQIKKITEPVQVPSNLYGKRDRVTEITFAHEQYPAMLSSNILSSVYEKKVTSIGSSLVSAGVTTSDGPGMVVTSSFILPFSQNVSYTVQVVNNYGYFRIGTSPGDNDVLECSSNSSGSALFLDGGITYYLEAYAEPCIHTPCTNYVSGIISYLASNDPNNAVISWERSEYTNNKFPIRTLVYDGTNWITTNTVVSRDEYGNILESQDINNIPTTIKYDNNSILPIAKIANSINSVCGYIGLENGWLDWESGGSTIINTQSHTGNYSANCQNAFGPTKNFFCVDGINLEKSYQLEAWVKVVSGSGLMGAEIRDAEDNCLSVVYQNITSAGGSGWQHISLTISPEQMVELPPNGYLRVWCGFPNSASNSGYVDDVRFMPLDAVMTSYSYDPNTLQVLSKTDANGVSEFYQYDNFGRLIQTSNDDGAVITQQTYYISREHNADVFNPSDPNYERTTTYPDGVNSTPVISTEYTDGLGRTIQTHSRDGNNDLVSAVDYDDAGRQYRSWKPYATTTLTYDPSYAIHAQTQYGITNPYSELTYYPDPLSRVQYSKPSGCTGSIEWTEMQYGSATISDYYNPYNGINLSYTDKFQSVGSNVSGRTVSRIYSDKLGRSVRQESYLEGSTTKLISDSKFTMLGGSVTTTDPNGFVSNYQYDFLGKVVQGTTVDQGTIQYLYDVKGKLRFMIDAVGQVANPNKTLYWKYDKFNRVIEKGFLNTNWSAISSLNVEDQTYPSTPATWRKKYHYDDFSIAPYAKGRLCKVQTNNDDNNDVDVEETFQFDKFGHTISVSNSIPDFSNGSYTTSYAYDNLGRVTQIQYPSQTMLNQLQGKTVVAPTVFTATSDGLLTVGPSFVVQSGATATIKSKLSVRLTSGVTVTQGSEFRAIVNTSMNSNMIVTYTYNQLGQLTGIGNSSNNNYFAQYIYNPDGTVSQEKVNNLSSVTNYQFNNPRGFLTSISNSAFTENLSYTNGFGGANYYNGSIASSSFNYGAGGPTSYNYTFQYDQYNRMTNAANSANASYNYTSIQYDNNGNLSYRLDGTSGVKNFTYHSGTNKLKNLTGAGTAYFYDENGNMTSTGGKTLAYDPFTMQTQSITEGSTQIRYQYDGRKERILKTVSQNGNNTSTLYLRGRNEYPLTEKIGSSQNAIDRFYVYGLKGLVAVVDNGATYFVLKDHLGSTRAVLDNNNVAVSWYDYTPYGSVWRTTISEDMRYRFTGQEYDYETNLFNFRARMYDSELGIFYGVDPAGQGFAPYSYCGGNPTMYIDKDGRFFWVPFIIGAAIGGFTGHKIGEARGATGWGMFGYIFGGAVIGGFSGALGAQVAAGGGVFANTSGLMVSSTANSLGLSALSGGTMNPSINFGVGSIDLLTGKVGYLGKKGNSTLENIGYGLGAIANVEDVLAGANPGDVKVRTENTSNPQNKDLIGHSQLTDIKDKPLIDWGPQKPLNSYTETVPGTNSYEGGNIIPAEHMKGDPVVVKGVNVQRIINYSNTLTKEGGNFNFLTSACVTKVSNALNMAGVINIGIHPYLLHLQLYLRSLGLTPSFLSYAFYIAR